MEKAERAIEKAQRSQRKAGVGMQTLEMAVQRNMMGEKASLFHLQLPRV